MTIDITAIAGVVVFVLTVISAPFAGISYVGNAYLLGIVLCAAAVLAWHYSPLPNDNGGLAGSYAGSDYWGFTPPEDDVE